MAANIPGLPRRGSSNCRWNSQLDLRRIKAAINLGRVRCMSPAMVHREVWTSMLAYNLIRTTAATAATAAELHGKLPGRSLHRSLPVRVGIVDAAVAGLDPPLAVGPLPAIAAPAIPSVRSPTGPAALSLASANAAVTATHSCSSLDTHCDTNFTNTAPETTCASTVPFSPTPFVSTTHFFAIAARTRSVIAWTSASRGSEESVGPAELAGAVAGAMGGGGSKAVRCTPARDQLSRKMSLAQMSQFLYWGVLRGSVKPQVCLSSSNSRSLSAGK